MSYDIDGDVIVDAATIARWWRPSMSTITNRDALHYITSFVIPLFRATPRISSVTTRPCLMTRTSAVTVVARGASFALSRLTFDAELPFERRAFNSIGLTISIRRHAMTLTV